MTSTTSDSTSANSRLAPRLDRLAFLGLPVALFVFHLATAQGYGIFRDELYYLSCARRLAWGYVDHPPMVAWLTRLLIETLGDSLLVLRGFAGFWLALAVGLLVAATREAGGGVFAQRLAGVAVTLAPVLLALGSILSMNGIDIAIHAAMWWLLLRWLRTGNDRLWLGFGLIAGAGLLTKASTAFFGVGLAVALVLLRRDALRRPQLWAGGAIAVGLGLPHLLWQKLNDWPTLEFARNASEHKNVALAPWDLAIESLLQFGPLGGVLALAGLAVLFRPIQPGRRLLALIPMLVFGLMLVANAKPYYLAASFLGLIVGGALVAEAVRRRTTVVAAIVVLGLLTAVAAPLAKPILPLETYVRYAEVMGDAPSTAERHELGRLKQFYADMIGWRSIAATVGAAAAKLDPTERAQACVFVGNYGEAGAIEHFGGELDLPPPISGHNTWWLWGPGSCTGEVLLVLSRDRSRLDELFESVELGAATNCGDCMPYENDVPVWIVRGPRQGVDLQTLWPKLKHYD